MTEERFQDLTDSVRQAISRESEAWQQLRRAPQRLGSEERRDVLRLWVDTQRLLREAEEQLTASALSIARDSLRDCAETLRQAPTAAAPLVGGYPAAERLSSTPVAGQVFHGRRDSIWDVVAVTHDRLEPTFWLVQLQQRGKGEEPVDVYSDDWTLFCILNGLRGPA